MGKLVAVSLRDVPIGVRRRAAKQMLAVARDGGDIASLGEVIELERAVEAPSATLYLLPADAVLHVLAEYLPGT